MATAMSTRMSCHVRIPVLALAWSSPHPWPEHGESPVAQMVVEPSGAVALAAALTPEFQELARRRNLRRIGIILSGGNVDLAEAGLWRELGGEG